jgi:hypothetical protein
VANSFEQPSHGLFSSYDIELIGLSFAIRLKTRPCMDDIRFFHFLKNLQLIHLPILGRRQP